MNSNGIKQNLQDFFENEIKPKSREVKLECTNKNASLSCSYQEITDVKKNQDVDDIITFLHVDSRQRDLEKYPSPASYNIFLHKEYQFIKAIHLRSIEYHDPPTPINNKNNHFRWITNYCGIDSLITTNVEYDFYMPKNYYTYQSFINTFETSINEIRHDIPSSIPSISNIHNTFPIFDMFINNSTKKLEIIQRLEKLSILSMCSTQYTNCIEFVVKNISGKPFDEVNQDVPIILSGLELYLKNVGGIPTHLLSNVPFFPKNSPLKIKSRNIHNYYEYVGTGGLDEYKYELYVYTSDGIAVKSTGSEIVSNLDENKILYNLPTKSYVGRALSFQITTDNCGTFSNYLGLITIDMDIYVHTNMDYALNEVKNKIPWKVVSFEELALSIDDYIFMRIGTSSQPKDKISNNLVCAKGCFKNTLLINDKENFFFAKILFTDRFPGDITINFIAGDKFFYQETIDKMSDISVEFYNAYGELLELDQDNSFTLEIIETRTFLHGTYNNSQTGN